MKVGEAGLLKQQMPNNAVSLAEKMKTEETFKLIAVRTSLIPLTSRHHHTIYSNKSEKVLLLKLQIWVLNPFSVKHFQDKLPM